MARIDRRAFLSSCAAGALLRGSSDPERTHLLLDRRLIDRVENGTLRACRAEKDRRNPLFGQEKSWEVRYDNLYPNVHRDVSSGLYQCWYSPFIVDEAVTKTPIAERAKVPYSPRRREMGVCYAESKDGIRWTKPDLGLVEFEGSRRNNLVVRGPHGAGVYFDAHDTEPGRRFKMFYSGRGISAAFSPDGMRWSAPVHFPRIDAVGDTHNNAIWVSSLGKYVGITRLWDRKVNQRLVARTESPDFTGWTKAAEVLRAAPGSPESQTYSMPIFEYEGLLLGLLAVFHVPTDTVQTELAWSPDSVRWERIDPGSPVLALGPAGAPDSHCIYAAAPVFEKDEIRIYYGGSNGPHTGWRDGFFCLARLRPGRFAAFEPNDPSMAAAVITQPVKVASPDLRINASAEGGQVRVAVLDSGDDNPLSLEEFVPIQADVVDGACRWKRGDLGRLIGKEVRLVFSFRRARLFGFRFQ